MRIASVKSFPNLTGGKLMEAWLLSLASHHYRAPVSAQRARQALPGGKGICAGSHVGGPKSSGTLRRAQKSFVPDAACPLVDRHKPLSKVSVPLRDKNVPVHFARWDDFGSNIITVAIDQVWLIKSWGRGFAVS